MTPIRAKVLNVDRLGSISHNRSGRREKYNGTFDRLTFGENKPQLGSYRNGWLDLTYHQNPGLKRTQLDRLYQRIVDDLDELLGAVGLKAA